MSVDMHSLDRVNMARDRQRSCNIGPGVIGAYPRFVHASFVHASLASFHASSFASFGSYDRATELEELGGKVLDLTRSDWEALAR